VPINVIATLDPGKSHTITIILDNTLANVMDMTLVQNIRVEVAFCATAGGNYPKVAVLS